ncbi:MAG: beta-ketoacyl-[acyl-carrier-protein] synthase family protein [Nanoarchaeota archaeon]|nr:beta-ketoacyl-[acyl-carrier-protein] synthase family protein [Nanoarchaeota archaeon]
MSPLGHESNSQFWEGLLEGKTNYREITRFPLKPEYETTIAGEIQGFDPKQYIGLKTRAGVSRIKVPNAGFSIFYGLRACDMAIEDSGMDLENEDPRRVGIAVGTYMGDNPINSSDATRMHYLFYSVAPALSSCISQEYGLIGSPFATIPAACATGNMNIDQAYKHIILGEADAFIAGSSSMHLTVPHPFEDIIGEGTPMSKSHDTKNPMKPFDINRDGFIISEGAGILILEELGHAQKRNAKIYAEILGTGSLIRPTKHFAYVTSDGYLDVMIRALKNSGIDKDHLRRSGVYICTHGTATRTNDFEESDAIRRLYGEDYRRPFVGSLKGTVGHAQEASSAQEAIASSFILKENKIPPTTGLENPDPECGDMNFVMGEAVDHEVDLVISNSAGFGGIYSTVVLG